MELIDLIATEVKFSAVRSRGPGGQNVNKVSSAAILYWFYADSKYLSEEQKYKVQAKLANQINKEGFLYLRSDESRDLEMNKKRCLEKLDEMLAKAFFEHKKRRATKPTYSSTLKRKDSKKRRGVTKDLRGKVKY